MKKLTLSLLCAGLITTSAIAEDICIGAFEAHDDLKASECYVQQLKKEQIFTNFLNAGISYCAMGRYTEALFYLQKAEKKALTPNEYKVLYSYLGNTYGSLNDKVQELSYLMKSLELSLKLGDTSQNIGTSYDNLAVYYRNDEKPQKALEYSKKALEYEKESERAYTYANMAEIYYDMDDPKKTEEMYQLAIAIDESIGAHNVLGYHKAKFGTFYFSQKRYDSALSMLKDARTIGHNAGNVGSESYTLSYIARIDYQNGQISQSKQEATEALNLAKQSGDTGLLSIANKTWNIVNGK